MDLDEELWHKCLRVSTKWETDEWQGEGKVAMSGETLTGITACRWGVLHLHPWNPPIKQTNKVTRCTNSPTCHLPPSAYPGNPFPSSSLSGKSMNTEGHLRRQVRISLSKPHNAIKPTTNQCTHGWLGCACTPLISVDLPLSHQDALLVTLMLRKETRTRSLFYFAVFNISVTY